MKGVVLVDDIIEIVRTVLETEKNLETDIDLFDEFGMDSLQVVDLIVALEEKFGIEFQEEDFLLKNFRTIETIIYLVNEKLQ